MSKISFINSVLKYIWLNANFQVVVHLCVVCSIHNHEKVVNLSIYYIQNFVQYPKIWIIYCLRPYHVENTSSRPITEVKQH